MKFVSEVPEAIAGRRPKYVTEAVRRQLASQPGEWALLDFDTVQAVSALRTWCSRHPEFEMRARTREGGSAFDIFMRCIGDA